jgi:LysR family transcriptional regulator, mexEF-oprN operon transcriptional activator
LNVVSYEINERELRRVDLNLLVVFAALMRDRSVKLAAQRLFLGPSAVSMALVRLRELFKDELFVRGRGAMEPTHRAEALHARLGGALDTIQSALFQTAAFDPARVERTLRFASPDDLEVTLLPRLLDHLRVHAPGIRLIVRPSDFQIVLGLLDSAEADVALTAPPRSLERRHRQEVQFRDGFVAVFDPSRVGPIKRLSLEKYLSAPHILLSPSGEFHGPIDDHLARLGRERHVLAAVSHFSTIPFTLKAIPAFANMPSVSAHHYAEQFGLAVAQLPFESPSFDVSLLWHARSDGDPVIAWFRGEIKRLLCEMRGAVPRARRPKLDAPGRPSITASRPQPPERARKVRRANVSAR